MKMKPLNLAVTVAIMTMTVGCSQTEQQMLDEKKDIGSRQRVDSVIDDSETERSNLEATDSLAEIILNKPKQQLPIQSLMPTPTQHKKWKAQHPIKQGEVKIARKDVMGKMAYPASAVMFDAIMPFIDENRENYQHYEDNPLKRVEQQPVSTFSIDVDTGSYANVRRLLAAGQLPPSDAVRAEELINYFDYAYPVPDSQSTPFSVFRELAATPWNPNTLLLHVGLQGYDIPANQLPASNLVFLVDVSGSMQSANKLELLKSSLKLLTNQLDKNDKVSIVVYAGASGIVLQPTAGNNKAQITQALARLEAGGSTNGAAGIRLAYSMAEQAFIPGGINRVLIATDGDFNVGTVNHQQLLDLIKEKRKSGIALSTLGFGSGNYNDHLMEQLADHGNGNYAYIDSLNEAQKVLVDEMNSTLMTIAKDVKIQIEFNPALVSEYRLIGYENRNLKREDFNNDKVDAGEIGAGHTVTAIYEIALADSSGQRIDNLRYQNKFSKQDKSNELAFLRLRYKQPDSQNSQLLEWPITQNQQLEDLQQTSNAFRFSAAVAAFAQQLRGGTYLEQFSYPEIVELARGARGDDNFGYRGSFIQMVQLAQSLTNPAKISQRQTVQSIY